MLEVQRVKNDPELLAEVSEALASEDWDSKVYRRDEPEKLLSEFISRPSHVYIIARINDQICGRSFGYILQHPNGSKRLYVDEVDTLPQYRKKGVATAMIKKMLEIAKGQALDEVWVEAESDNLAANKTYNKFEPKEVVKANNYTYKLVK